MDGHKLETDTVAPCKNEKTPTHFWPRSVSKTIETISRQLIQKVLEHLANVSDVDIFGDFTAMPRHLLHAEHMDLVIFEIHFTKPHMAQSQNSHEKVIKC
jgi:hypothetical protein